MLSASSPKGLNFMQDIFKTRLIVFSAAASLLISGIFGLHTRDCFLPSPAAESFADERSLGGAVIVSADDVEFSCKLFEWLKELF